MIPPRPVYTCNVLKAIDASIDIEKWIADKLAAAMAIPGKFLNASVGYGTYDDPQPPTVGEQIRNDCRLIQILRGVKAGTITVDDAAAEIIAGRGLDIKTTLHDSAAAQLVKPWGPKKLFGLDVLQTRPWIKLFGNNKTKVKEEVCQEKMKLAVQ